MTTQLLAQIIGPTLFLLALSLLLRPKMYRTWFTHIAWTVPTIITVGIIEFIFGISIALTHTTFESFTAGLITILGYYMIAEGACALLINTKLLKILTRRVMGNRTAYLAISSGVLLIGLWLSYQGYVAI